MIHYKNFNENEFNLQLDNKGKCNNIFCLDIETSSYWLINNEIVPYKEYFSDELLNNSPCGAICYLWQFGVDNSIYYGRSLKELKEFLLTIKKITEGTEPIIYIHNLSYEFHFLTNILDIEEVFARQPRKPMYFRSKGIEFRCSYILTGLSLARWGETLGINKLKEIMDYNVLRTPKTRLDDNTLKYSERDIEIMLIGIKKYQSDYGNIHNIPLTHTGITRRKLNNIFQKDYDYHSWVTRLQPGSYNSYKWLRTCFSGGACATVYTNADRIINNGGSYDLTSDYPFQLVANKYPCSPFIECNYDIDNLDINKYAYIICIKMKNVKSKYNVHSWSRSHCVSVSHGQYDNGKLISCDECVITFTEIDFITFRKNYNIGEKEVLYCKKSRKEYLDKRFVLFILENYANKTKLKDVEDMEELYMNSKATVNSLYGLCVTDILNNEISFKNNEWQSDKPNADAIFSDLKTKKYKNTVAYQWGVWCTAYARYTLFRTILHIEKENKKAFNINDIYNSDVCYYDTDSCKLKNVEKWTSWFESENELIKKSVIKALKYHNIPLEYAEPANIKGEKKFIGVWEREKDFVQAKFLGAKKYAVKYKDDDSIHITVAGVPKKCGIALKSLDDFKNGFVFDKDLKNKDNDYINKKTIKYCDGDNYKCIINKGLYDEYKVVENNSIVIRNGSYTLGLTSEYKDLIAQAKQCMRKI